MATIFGLDFGTTNSALSINIDGEVEMVDIDRLNINGITLKSVIYYDMEEKKFYVGQEAINRYVENDAYGRYIQSAKAFLSDQSFEYTEIGGKTYRIDELIAIILRTIKERGQKYIGKEINNVVLGRPVIFSENPDSEKLAVKRLLSAATLAGFSEIYLQYEPIAAALSFESTLPHGEEKILLVGDFGGGTSDFTVIKMKGGKNKEKVDRKEDILGLSGVYIGGDTFDSQLMWQKVAYYFGRDVRVKALYGNFDLPVSSTILNNLRKWHLIPQLRHPKNRRSIKEIKHLANKPKLIENLENLIDDNYGYMLFQAIEKAKCELSLLMSTIIDFKEFHLKIQEEVNRMEFESFIASDVQKIELCVEEVIRQANINYSDIDVVYLTGGSSLIPLIKNIFIKKFGGERINQSNVFTSIANGLGINGNLYL